MTLQPWQVAANAKLTIGGSDGFVAQTDSNLTFVAREDGTVDTFTTEHVLSEGKIVLSEVEQQALEQSDHAKDMQIAQLEQELSALRSGPTSTTPPANVQPVPGPAAPATPTADPGDVTTSPVTTAPTTSAPVPDAPAPDPSPVSPADSPTPVTDTSGGVSTSPTEPAPAPETPPTTETTPTSAVTPEPSPDAGNIDTESSDRQSTS